jgi:hypothetical protein
MTEVWELAYFGQGGFPYEQVWNMPVTSRRFFLKKTIDHVKAVKEAQEAENNIITENTKIKDIPKIDVPPHLIPKQEAPSYVSKVKSNK